MTLISDPVVKRDHDDKVSGRAVYLCDYPPEGILTGKLLRSKYAKARILGVDVPELPEGYVYADARDIPGDNNVSMVCDDTPVFTRETAEYIGDVIGIIAGPDPEIAEKLVSQCQVHYEELEPVLDMEKSEDFFFDYSYGKGDVDKAFAEADHVFTETLRTGHTEQAYMETQSMMAQPEADGSMCIHGSLQCPFYVKNALKRVLGLPADKVHVFQDITGGAFGGKEGFPSILGAQAAVAANKAKAPVRCVFDRREDIEFTSKKHPSVSVYKAAVKDGKITAMDIDVKFNAGAYTTLTPVVLQRGIICASGVYNVENLRVRGRAVKTNSVPNGAYRGFGGPQTFFTVETFVSHIAKKLGVDVIEFKKANLCKQGDLTSTSGKYHFRVPLPEMIREVDEAVGYTQKRREYSQPQSGRYRKGIGMALCFHGAGFTGSAEKDIIKAVARLHKYSDGSVEILISNTDMGQGLHSTVPKIAAKELNLPYGKIKMKLPDTDRVPDSGPTAASRSMMVVGELVRRASIKLREKWIDGEEQVVEEQFKQPEFMIPFTLANFHGDAYPTYAWAVNAVEVELDTLTGLTKVTDACGSFEVGTPIDENIVVGQMEGGFLQSLGCACIEHIGYDSKGRIRNNSFSDFLIPTAKDVPHMKAMLHVVEYPNGPYGAKGAGELPAVCAPAAYINAVEQALGEITEISYAPISAENICEILAKEA